MEAAGDMRPGVGWRAAHIFPENGFKWAKKQLDPIRKQLQDWDLINAYENGFWTDNGRHLGTHTKKYVESLIEAFDEVSDKDSAIAALESMWQRIQKYEWGSH